MTVLAALIPVSLSLGLLGLVAFVWSLRTRQYDDLEGDQYRALFGGNDDAPRAEPAETLGSCGRRLIGADRGSLGRRARREPSYKLRLNRSPPDHLCWLRR